MGKKPGGIEKIKDFLVETRDLQLIKRSGYFNKNWYMETYPELRGVEVNPLRHYLRKGGFEGRDPSPLFSSSWYLQKYDDVKKAGINPLLHYIKCGKREGRQVIFPDHAKADSILLTVIVIAYNHEKSISRAIESVLEQNTVYPFEIWIHEDCSTDGTLQVCKEYANRYPDRIKLFAQAENRFSRPDRWDHIKEVLSHLKTRYFCVLDGDDEWCDTQKIQVSLDILEKNPQYIMVAHDTLINDVQKNTRRSLVHEVVGTEVKNPVTFTSAPLLFQTSSRVYRNVVDSSVFKNFWDVFIFYTYLDYGPLYYVDRIMSIYNSTGSGMYSKLSQSKRTQMDTILQGTLNKNFGYRYDEFFTQRLRKDHDFLLKLKKILGVRIAWELWILVQRLRWLFIP